MILLLLAQGALAVDWMETHWSEISDRYGVVRLSAGMPLRVRDGSVHIREADGTPVPLRAGVTDWWIDPVARTRLLETDGNVELLTVDQRQWDADWAAWEHDAAQALARRDPVRLPPDGVGRLSARVQARAAALGRGVAQLGLWVDLVRHRPLSRLGLERDGRETLTLLQPGESVSLEVHGYVELGLRPITEAFERVEVDLDGEVRELATTGAFRRVERHVRGRGAPPMVVTGDPEFPIEVWTRQTWMRGWLLLPGGTSRPSTGIDAAEWDVLHGIPADFSPWLDDRDPDVARWARIRSLESASGRELLDLADPLVEGDAAVAHTVLDRANDLPLDLVLTWLERAPHPDLRVLADWLDSQRASRSHGLDLLERARAGKPADVSLALDQLRHRSRVTRWASMDSDRDAEGEWRFSTSGQGVPRVSVDAGRSAVFTVETADPSLQQIVHWSARPGTVAQIAGRRFEGEGELSFALPTGTHVVAVESGGLLAPSRGWLGGETGVGWRAVPTPAVFQIPGLGARMELQVESGGEEVWLAFDDGRVVKSRGGPVEAGPFATSVEIRGGSVVGLAGRIIRVGTEELENVDAAEALEVIEITTRAIDAGDGTQRARRALALARLGSRRLAWRDVAALEKIDRDLQRRTWAQLASLPVVTEREGALDAHTARVMGQPGRALALEALENEDWVTAAVRAQEAGDGQTFERAVRGMSWKALTRLDDGAGLRPVKRAARPSLTRMRDRVERALVLAPWPDEETVLVREGSVDRIATPTGKVSLQVWCRDLSLDRDPCLLPAFGAGLPGAVISDGSLEVLQVKSTAVELGPVDPSQVVVVRAEDGNGLLAAQVEQLGVVVRGRGTVRLPPDRLVRLEVMDGEVQTTALELGTLDGRRVVHPQGKLTLTGSGTVLLWVSEQLPLGDEDDADVPDRPAPIALIGVDDLWPELERATHRTLPRGASSRFSVAGIVNLDGQFRSRWTAGQLEGGLYHASSRGWWLGEAWFRGPGGAGLRGEKGLRWGRNLFAVRGFAHSTLQLDAGEVGVEGYARAETGPRVSWIRVEVWPGASWVSLQPRREVDPRAWSRYRLAHFVGVDARVTWLAEPTRDLRLRLYGQVNSNTDLTLDRTRLGTQLDLLFSRHTRLTAASWLDRAFADAHRVSPTMKTWFAGGLENDFWRDDRRYILFADAQVSPSGGFSGQAGLALQLTRGRGLRDAPPTRDLFRTEREGR